MALTQFLTLFANERERYPLFVPVLLALGIGVYFALPVEPVPSLAGLLPVIGGLMVLLARRRFGLRLLTIALLIMAVGFLAASIRTQLVAAPSVWGTLFFRDVEGRIEDIQDKATGAQKLVLNDVRIERLEKVPARISVSFKKPLEGLAVGDRIRTRAMLFPPPGPTMPGAFDFARQFYFDRIGAVGFSPHTPELLEHTPASRFTESLNRLRLSVNDRILAHMQPQNGPVAAAMMVGEMSAVDKEVGAAMRDAGIYHVLSISGLHMSIAAALMYVSVRLLLSLWPRLALRLPAKKIAAFVGLLGSFAYLLLAGYPVPAIRSFIMVACVMVAVLCDRRGVTLYSLAWSAVLILLFQPEALLGASFQLSYAATVSILAFYERYQHVLLAHGRSIAGKVYAYFLGLMLTSLVASLATTPLVIYHFNRVGLWAIIANMLMMPLASFWIMPLAVLAFLAMPFGAERVPLELLDKGIGWMVEGSRMVASLPYAGLNVPSPSFAGILLVVAGGLWLCIWQKRWRLLGIPFILLGMATAALHKPYDILISDDATKVAWRMEPEVMLFIKGKPTSFDGEHWLRANGGQAGMLLKEARGEAAPVCDKQACVFETHGKRVAVARRKDDMSGVCREGVDIAIGPYWMDRRPECQQVRWLIDRAFLRKSGAVGIRFEGERVVVETAEEKRGLRPWNKRGDSPLVQADNPSMMPAEEQDEK